VLLSDDVAEGGPEGKDSSICAVGSLAVTVACGGCEGAVAPGSVPRAGVIPERSARVTRDERVKVLDVRKAITGYLQMCRSRKGRRDLPG
jgi:hypothetical protein